MLPPCYVRAGETEAQRKERELFKFMEWRKHGIQCGVSESWAHQGEKGSSWGPPRERLLGDVQRNFAVIALVVLMDCNAREK